MIAPNAISENIGNTLEQQKQSGLTFEHGKDNISFNYTITMFHMNNQTGQLNPFEPETIDYLSDFVTIHFPEDFPNGLPAGWEPVFENPIDETGIANAASGAIYGTFDYRDTDRIDNGINNEAFNDIVAASIIDNGIEGDNYSIIENTEGIFVKPVESIFNALSYDFALQMNGISFYKDFPIGLGNYADFVGFKVYNPGGIYSDYFTAKDEIITLLRIVNAGDETEIAAQLPNNVTFDYTTEEYGGSLYIRPTDSNIFDIMSMYVYTMYPNVYPYGLHVKGFAGMP